ncbi:hypothetical protein D3C76_736640 [compost metagenome]
MHATETTAQIIEALTQNREHILAILEALLTLLHLTTQVRASVEPVTTIGTIQVMQLVT